MRPGEVEIDSKVMLVTGEERSFTIAVELAVRLPGLDDEEAVDWSGRPQGLPVLERDPRQHRRRPDANGVSV